MTEPGEAGIKYDMIGKCVYNFLDLRLKEDEKITRMDARRRAALVEESTRAVPDFGERLHRSLEMV
jgi:hypothetical protein